MNTTQTDSHGVALSGATSQALDAYEQATRELRCLVGDPVANADRALAAAPAMPMAHLLKAWLFLLGTEPAGPALARAECDAAAALPMNEGERAHLQAARLLAQGEWHAAARVLEDRSLHEPRDLVALQVGHQIDFFVGDSRMLRDRIARALPHWQRGMPGHHAVLGMHAFGLEETGDYAQAERQGRLSVELEPHDSWGWHAVAHVHEMRNDAQAGIAWLAPHAPTWSDGSFLAVHNWWHLALFHLEQDDTEEALRLYDASIGGPGSSIVLELVDQSAMLWRLLLRGVDVGDRWASLADRWSGVGGSGRYAFNDFHAMLAFVGAGRVDAQQAVLEAQLDLMGGGGAAQAGDNGGFTRDVGHAATAAARVFGQGDYAGCANLLRPIRHRAHRFGGSHAQRDVIDLTLIEAALRSGDHALAAGLAAERAALRPRSALVQRFIARSSASALAA